MNVQRSNSLWKGNNGKPVALDPKRQQAPLEQLKVPYIPQPDYTPLPTRRAQSFRVQPSSAVVKPAQLNKEPQVPAVQPIPRLDTDRLIRPVSSLLAPPEEDGTSITSSTGRVWHHPQWQSSQFPAHEWSAALMKRLSVEAKTRREEKIRRAADTELDRFESEIDSYLEADEEEETPKSTQQSGNTNKVRSGASTPHSSSMRRTTPSYPASPGSSSSDRGASSGDGGSHVRSASGHTQLESSGYVSSAGNGSV